MWVTETDKEIVNLAYVRSVYVEKGKKGYDVVGEWSTGDPNVIKNCSTEKQAMAIVARIKQFLHSDQPICDIKEVG